ncbi:protein PDF [Armigeres subalbatus]|uniref:protein PDF n=1 Tax=Armigeres subalbatus TaxID=124917 RepID=UPI002ED077E2
MKATFFVVVCLCFSMCSSLPSYDTDLADIENDQYMRQLTEWLANTDSNDFNELYSSPACRACFYRIRDPYVNVVSDKRYGKRNSELINSLLSLPKKLNDAGK